VLRRGVKPRRETRSACDLLIVIFWGLRSFVASACALRAWRTGTPQDDNNFELRVDVENREDESDFGWLLAEWKASPLKG
jgi:hypothetical protein